MEPTKKKKIIIVLIILLIMGIIIAFMLAKKSNTNTSTDINGKTGVDLGQLDPNKKGTNPDGTPIVSGTLPGTGSTTNADGTYTVYPDNNSNYTTIGSNTNGTNGTGAGSNGTGNGTGQSGGGLGWNNASGGFGSNGTFVDLTGNGSGGGIGNDPCSKAYNDMTSAERDLCIGAPNSGTPTEDNTLILTDAQRSQLDDLDRTFYRTAPALANPDILADYIDEVKSYTDTHNKLKTNINQCVALIDQPSKDQNSFQFQASYLGIDGRTWYRGNLKNGYTPGFSRVSGSQVGRPIDIGNDPTYPTGSYYYLKYYGETSYKSGVPFIDAFSRRGGATFTTNLENKLKGGWFDRGTFLITNTNTGVGKDDPENLRQFEELFEIY